MIKMIFSFLVLFTVIISCKKDKSENIYSDIVDKQWKLSKQYDFNNNEIYPFEFYLKDYPSGTIINDTLRIVNFSISLSTKNSYGDTNILYYSADNGGGNGLWEYLNNDSVHIVIPRFGEQDSITETVRVICINEKFEIKKYDNKTIELLSSSQRLVFDIE